MLMVACSVRLVQSKRTHFDSLDVVFLCFDLIDGMFESLFLLELVRRTLNIFRFFTCQSLGQGSIGKLPTSWRRENEGIKLV